MADKLYKFTLKMRQQDIWSNARMCADIKYHGIEVGELVETNYSNWTIHLIAPASEESLAHNPNCPWRWIKVKQVFTSKEEARDWLNDNREMVLAELYFEER